METYTGFAPINYNNSSDEYICNTDNYPYVTNTMETIESINNNIDIQYLDKDKNNKLFSIKSDLLEYLRKNYKIEKKDDFIGKNLVSEFDNFMKYFSLKQNELLKAEKELMEEMKSNKDDLKQMDSLIVYYDNLSKKYDEDDKSTIECMEKLAENIKKNSRINEINETYILRKNEMMQYLDIIKYLNKANLGNTCSICLTNNVDIYFNPCGHTTCEECYKKQVESSNSQDMENKCVFCRKVIFNTNKLYYI